MRRPTATAEARRGATLVLTAVTMTTILGFVALAVDTTVMAVARHQLGIASDAAALAGASAMADERRLNPNADLDPIFAKAHARAQQLAESNLVLGLKPVIVSNAGNAPDGDVVLGYIADHRDPSSPFVSDAAQSSRFNSVRVRAMRSPDRGGLIPAIFANVMGFEGASVRVVGTASALNYDIAGFSAETNRNADLMPFALERNLYEKVISQDPSTTDDFAFDPETRQVTNGSDGIRESQIFPVSTGPGNWGTVNIGVNNNSTNTLRAQIRDGVTPQQLATYPGGQLTLNQADGNGNRYVMLGGNPGISAGMKSALEDIIGETRTVPIYEGWSGNGNNVQYKIVGFRPIRMLAVNFQGNNKYVIVQPAITRDPTAIPGEVLPDWSGGGLIRLNLTR